MRLPYWSRSVCHRLCEPCCVARAAAFPLWLVASSAYAFLCPGIAGSCLESYHVELRRHTPMLPHYLRSWRIPDHATAARHMACQWQPRRLPDHSSQQTPACSVGCRRTLIFSRHAYQPASPNSQPDFGVDPLSMYCSPAHYGGHYASIRTEQSQSV
jgi:hypothetical protein